MDARRNKLSPKFVDKLLYLREAYLEVENHDMCPFLNNDVMEI